MWGVFTQFNTHKHKLLITDSGIEKKEALTIKWLNKHLSSLFPRLAPNIYSAPSQLPPFSLQIMLGLPGSFREAMGSTGGWGLVRNGLYLLLFAFYSFSFTVVWVGRGPSGVSLPRCVPCMAVVMRPPAHLWLLAAAALL